MAVALVGFVAPGDRVIACGQLVDDDDPILAGREHLFDSAPSDVGAVEQATAAPGEVRRTSRPRRSKGD